jgi:ankyrin repeat protein
VYGTTKMFLSKDKDQQLRKAIKGDHIIDVIALLGGSESAQRLNINRVVDNFGNTVILCAAQHGRWKMIEYLQQIDGCDLCRHNNFGNNILTMCTMFEFNNNACEQIQHHKQCMRTLLSNGYIDANMRTTHGLTPLMCAVMRKHLCCARSLLRCSDIRINDEYMKMTALTFCIRQYNNNDNNTVRILRELLSHEELDVNLTPYRSPLLWCAVQGHVVAARQLLQHESVRRGEFVSMALKHSINNPVMQALLTHGGRV